MEESRWMPRPVPVRKHVQYRDPWPALGLPAMCAKQKRKNPSLHVTKVEIKWLVLHLGCFTLGVDAGRGREGYLPWRMVGFTSGLFWLVIEFPIPSLLTSVVQSFPLMSMRVLGSKNRHKRGFCQLDEAKHPL